MWKTDRSCYCQHKVLNKFKLIMKEKHQNVFNGKIELEREIENEQHDPRWFEIPFMSGTHGHFYTAEFHFN